MLRFFVHYGIHFLLPLALAFLIYKPKWIKAYLIMLCGLLIDLDHVLATPIFDANRCSINFHPLHSYYAIAIYMFLLFPKKTRILGIGLIVHILADTADCLLMNF
ncbi:MAG: DUF6122 family protein [Bacteroidota bacterium]